MGWLGNRGGLMRRIGTAWFLPRMKPRPGTNPFPEPEMASVLPTSALGFVFGLGVIWFSRWRAPFPITPQVLGWMFLVLLMASFWAAVAGPLWGSLRLWRHYE